MSTLPPELWSFILDFLSFTELTKINSISKFLREVIALYTDYKFYILLHDNNKENCSITEKFHWAAENGNLNLLKWLYLSENINRNDINLAFGWVVGRYNSTYSKELIPNQLKILQWFYLTFDLTSNDILFNDYNYSFQHAAEKCNLRVLKWLYSTFNLAEKDINIDGIHAFQLAIKRNHNREFFISNKTRIKTLKWLHYTFNLTKEDIKSDNNYAFRWTVMDGNMEILQWLCYTFNFAKEDIIKCCWISFGHTLRLQDKKDIVSSIDPEILQWICSIFDLTEEDLENTCYNPICSCHVILDTYYYFIEALRKTIISSKLSKKSNN